MKHHNHDIGDDEIRIITPARCNFVISDGHSPNRPHRRRYLWLIVGGIIVLVTALVIWIWPTGGEESDDIADAASSEPEMVMLPAAEEPVEEAETNHGYAEMKDTTVSGIRLTIFTPVDAKPRLHVGADILADTTVVLVTEAADVRRDSGAINGAYVLRGQLVSKGHPKSGFCAIIGGTPIIGVADSTPYLEQAIESGGYFFRQFPLVVGSSPVVQKRRGRSLRKALVELDGRISLVITRSPVTMNRFAALLARMGVSNAIYLVGSQAYGFARLSDGTVSTFGTLADPKFPNTNYIYWR